jgi:hypothetical protein
VFLCRFGIQVQERGYTSSKSEFWVESMVQAVKKGAKGRSPTHPEHSAVSTFLTEVRLAELKIQNPDLQVIVVIHVACYAYAIVFTLLCLLQSHAEMFTSTVMRGTNLDQGFQDVILGTGALMGEVEQQQCRQSLIVLFSQFNAEEVCWSQDPAFHCEFMAYQYAHTAKETFHSTSYERVRSRESHNVLVFFDEGGVVAQAYIAKVLFFLKATLPVPDAHLLSAEQQAALEHDSGFGPVYRKRLCICDLCMAESFSSPLGVYYKVADYTHTLAKWNRYPLRFNDVSRKVVYVQEEGKNMATFIPYGNLSGMSSV